ncbi:class I SAM-dependent methyltransferase [Nocardia sp. BMG51109]|uniref:class I SAM-dependent methyltransferase n=1 Tax=Nocardia sp. BMG51109 TaxID=1056816 RepID=UPI000464D360|nr:methyltransferase domain-containing protein [Nocardia sp. BMG51109]
MRYNPDELFRSTAPYYARYRSGYPPEFFDRLVARFALDGTQQILDLGCGTGQIALPLAPHVGRVLAIDPEPSMLTEGGRLAEEREIDNIEWLVGDSYRLSELDLPDLTLATMGAAFHWMDRDAVLRVLDRLILPAGAVVIASGGKPETQTPPSWNDTITAIRTKYLGPDRRAGSSTYSHPEEGHADVLHRSPFSNVETVGWTWKLERDLDSLVGLQFSYSFSAPAQFDSEEQRAAFERELRDALTEQFPSGVFPGNIRTEALIATRS